MQTNDYYSIEIDAWNYITVCKKWLLSNRIRCLKLYNCVQTNDYYPIEIDAWNYITVCKQMIIIQ